MMMNISEQIDPILDASKKKKRNEFLRRLNDIWRPIDGVEFTAIGSAVDVSLNALEMCAREWLSESMDSVSEVTASPIALALISDALAGLINDLRDDIETKNLTSALGTKMKAIGDAKFNEISNRLNAQLSKYNETFNSFESISTKRDKRPAGRKPIYKWEDLMNIIWGKIYRGELVPKLQKDIELEFEKIIEETTGKESKESTARPHASKIWEEMQK